MTKKVELTEKVFLYLFFLYSILSSNNLTYGKPIISFIMWPALVCGFGIIVYRLVRYKDYIKTPGLYCLVALFLSICISTLINYRYSFKANIVFCVYWALYFFVIYLMTTGKDVILVFLKSFVIYATVAGLISIWMMFTRYSTVAVAPDTKYMYYSGFSIGRLWGVFINPNNGAITSALAIIMLVYFISIASSKLIKAMCGIDILLLVFYIALSDSRTGAICLGVVLAFYSFFCLWQRTEGIKKLLAVLLAVVLLVGGIYAPRKTKQAYNFTVSKIASLKSSDEDVKKEDTSNAEVIVVKRNYDISGDISNRRFDAWKSAVEVYLSSVKMIAFGASFRGFTDYARDNLPSTYIVNNDYTDFTTLDNEFFNIMDSQGTLGIVSLIAFLVFICVFIIKRIIKASDIKLLALLIALIFGLIVSACFCGVMFYHFSPNTIVFWMVLGSMVSILKKEEGTWEST